MSDKQPLPRWGQTPGCLLSCPSPFQIQALAGHSEGTDQDLGTTDQVSSSDSGVRCTEHAYVRREGPPSDCWVKTALLGSQRTRSQYFTLKAFKLFFEDCGLVGSL